LWGMLGKSFRKNSCPPEIFLSFLSPKIQHFYQLYQ